MAVISKNADLPSGISFEMAIYLFLLMGKNKERERERKNRHHGSCRHHCPSSSTPIITQLADTLGGQPILLYHPFFFFSIVTFIVVFSWCP